MWLYSAFIKKYSKDTVATFLSHKFIINGQFDSEDTPGNLSPKMIVFDVCNSGYVVYSSIACKMAPFIMWSYLTEFRGPTLDSWKSQYIYSVGVWQLIVLIVEPCVTWYAWFHTGNMLFFSWSTFSSILNFADGTFVFADFVHTNFTRLDELSHFCLIDYLYVLWSYTFWTS